MKGRLLFILSLWMALSVALLSALAPLGPPSSRLTGSAFNPATTAVVLKARAQAIPVTAQVSQPDGDGRLPALTFAIGLLSIAAMLSGILRLRPSHRFSRPQPAPRPFHLLSCRHARAPPASS
ncbi:hypothetical protein [Sphingobium sp.]|uniref:hypothetical protein n=1 Tax=Sphingobium sp. TaxID=1912891 RepID=UPI0035C6E1CB